MLQVIMLGRRGQYTFGEGNLVRTRISCEARPREAAIKVADIMLPQRKLDTAHAFQAKCGKAFRQMVSNATAAQKLTAKSTPQLTTSFGRWQPPSKTGESPVLLLRFANVGLPKSWDTQTVEVVGECPGESEVEGGCVPPNLIALKKAASCTLGKPLPSTATAPVIGDAAPSFGVIACGVRMMPEWVLLLDLALMMVGPASSGKPIKTSAWGGSEKCKT
mmetsp:Transcript_23286/g.51132  ORF Transcript_23286/g.51132 Transcript_23286/m.51132 type:complete len:219 (+) Transcript_23286:146-802(+)